MSQITAGIHHITAFVTNPQQNVDFYAGVLGLHLVKKTINFDAPEVYHLYFGDQVGSPGTAMTFFPWPNSRMGTIGGGQVGIVTFAVPVGTLGFWEERLSRLDIATEKVERFSELFLQFKDHDGLKLEMVERAEGAQSKWSFGGVSAEKAIKGFGGALLLSTAPDKTQHLLEHTMGLTRVGEEAGLVRYRSIGDIGNIIDINMQPVPWGQGGSGTIHHIAWRAKDDADQLAWREWVEENGYSPTPVVDRQYFNAVYFREAGGILFEIATDTPGFDNDEPTEQLGQKLMLPEWFEPHRSEIEANLLPFEVRVLKGDLS
ncbi:glyoxalase family protein [Paenibacillus shirakamiensis]|uniref:Glyoxalase family protein n=1 Tax=Paenibacillus shirakamiensis TaxID=1265935 RepID=A0ABS4JGA3_9BACL|nr:ring-cleaving dioxygenase [Paenibacillus shirakamiensis]MBP2000738.1 glyoxalase family protein [Paenibacillus shirakamiensis]